MPIKAVKITSKGQVTIPKEIRDLLESNIIEFEMAGGNIMLKPVKSIGGSLSGYTKKYVPLKAVREVVWERVAHDRTGQKTA
ncbi:MAG: hypothetical protein A3G39_05045 [Deltaproteobacteria bacterium RIFCSPLOWO2_12_FULL_43_16]|nr:MAG: hypothetical protein A2Z89_04220 [Deltaproteobacteria bacterium GWA2_43_19]OGQ09362.1 MAG: hypothetical protein A3D30_00925 [Deltaproteobacteria bacterium RIFCSPHIGHO2_02_FULL_43_33]OGQ37870.1 MAG: hypothetical protein A3A85_07215 [Deltaproteobacteria bacterium RIFCSPLOWO2_01_FULL_42_9]OGQ58591.1 MAG: hypothetical protein A3G39_05045 [Deltaproteobacteria bacterium RIFCSPLOWO2_12_FULL_43_16]HBR16804.1 AbrB family transcriptional regulator [Deltaproteobacteria bacterium]